MLRKGKFLSNFIPPKESDKPVCFYSEDHYETIKVNGKNVQHLCKCHHALVEDTDFDADANDYKLEILIDSGVSLKPSPLMPSTSLDELSFINSTLNTETYETTDQNG